MFLPINILRQNGLHLMTISILACKSGILNPTSQGCDAGSMRSINIYGNLSKAIISFPRNDGFSSYPCLNFSTKEGDLRGKSLQRATNQSEHPCKTFCEGRKLDIFPSKTFSGGVLLSHRNTGVWLWKYFIYVYNYIGICIYTQIHKNSKLYLFF